MENSSKAPLIERMPEGGIGSAGKMTGSELPSKVHLTSTYRGFLSYPTQHFVSTGRLHAIL
jgi:hypothetical protein